jgi:HptB-dependent secretion and biofilm anti anti-sigma factor
MTIQMYLDDKSTTIQLPSKLNFEYREEFQKWYKAQPKQSHFVLDFSKVEMIDSSGLGLMLLFRMHIGLEQPNISIVNCTTQVRSLFEGINFQDLFRLR